MTSIAFIAGTIPLILGHGAGAEVRGVTGITVFSGMLGVTLFRSVPDAGVLRHAAQVRSARQAGSGSSAFLTL
nr:RND multidrug efflux transporter, Acriflavin resistance protein [Raoultella sp. NCTC 9187]